MNCAELDTFLYPYLDGEFEFPERADFERHLAECSACAARYAREANFHRSFRAALQRAALETRRAPPQLRRKVFTELRRIERRRLGWQGGALAAAAAIIAIAGGYWARPRLRENLAEDAALHHANVLPPQLHDVPTEVVESWLGGKLDHRISVPRLPNSRVTGARISRLKDRPAAYISYEQDDRHGRAPRRLSLFVFDDAQRQVEASTLPAIQLEQSHGYNVALWREKAVVYELVSDLDEPDIRSLLDASARWSKTEQSRCPPDDSASAACGYPPAAPKVPSFVPASFQK